MKPPLVLLVVAACAPPRPGSPPARAQRPGPLLLREPQPAPPEPEPSIAIRRPATVAKPCVASTPPPRLAPAFAPTLSGGVTLISARGDPRVAMQDSELVTWSADGSHAMLRDGSTVTKWRSSDGTPVDRIACPGRSISAAAGFAMSPDRRRMAISGFQGEGGTFRPVTCVIDWSSRAARIFPGTVLAPRFDGNTLVGADESLDLATGVITPHPRPATWPPSPAQPTAPPAARFDTGGAETFTLSHDRRTLAGWTVPHFGPPLRHGELRPPAPPPPPPRPQFLAVWDRATGKRLWRDATRCCGWRFSPGDRFLEASPGGQSENHELVRVASGEVIEFPGTLLPVAPGDRRVFLLHEGQRAPGYLELWSADPPRPVAPALLGRHVIARSRDGSVTVAVPAGAGNLVIERPGRCFALDIGLDSRFAIELSPDGNELYLGDNHSGPDRGSWFRRWRTDTGELAIEILVAGPAQFYPMTSVGQVGIAAAGQIQVYDVHTGERVTRVAAPRVRLHPTTRWPQTATRDPHGPHADAFHGPVAAFADGRHLIGHSRVERLAASIWDLHDPRLVQDLAAPAGIPPTELATTAMAVAPDERHVAAGLEDGVVALWSRTGSPIPVAGRHDGGVGQLAFSPDGGAVASTDYSGVVLVTDTTSGATLGAVELAPDAPSHVWWSADSAQLVIDTTRGSEITVAVPRPSPAP